MVSRPREHNAEWMKAADCIDYPDLFFPKVDDQGEDYWVDEARAREICSRCPYELRCRDYAVTGREPDGIWGNTDASERRKIRLKNVKTLPTLIQEVRPAIQAVASSYVFAQEVLDAQSKMQNVQKFHRKR